MAEHLTVAQVVVGSRPIIRPEKDFRSHQDFGSLL